MRGSGVIQLDRPERKMEATNDWEISTADASACPFAKVIRFQVLLSIVTS
jgi:hypothetical protein